MGGDIDLPFISLKPNFKVSSQEQALMIYERIRSEFESFKPRLKKRVTVNSIESMRESIDQGLLYEAHLDGQRVGLIAGERSSFLGHPGIYFQEIFISKDFKGIGLAKALQRKFVRESSNDGEYIWGTIDSLNLPSYRTAIGNGRIPIRYECFLKI